MPGRSGRPVKTTMRRHLQTAGPKETGAPVLVTTNVPPVWPVQSDFRPDAMRRRAVSHSWAARVFFLGRTPMGRDTRARMYGIGNDHGKATSGIGDTSDRKSVVEGTWV